MICEHCKLSTFEKALKVQNSKVDSEQLAVERTVLELCIVQFLREENSGELSTIPFLLQDGPGAGWASRSSVPAFPLLKRRLLLLEGSTGSVVLMISWCEEGWCGDVGVPGQHVVRISDNC